MEQNTLPSVAEIAIADVQKMGEIAASSRLFGIEDATAATALMLMAQAEGRHPMLAARDYHVIKGKPALKADAMLARFQIAGGKVEWQELTDTRACATFTHPQAGSVKIDWDMDRARKAGLCGNPTWQKFPRAMLRSRVISEGIRTAFPAVLCGFYTKEEVEDIIFDEESRKAKQGEEPAPTATPKRKSQKDALKAAAEKAAKPKPEAVEVEAEVVKPEPAPADQPAPAGFKKADASSIAERLAAEADAKETAKEAFKQAEEAVASAPEPAPEPSTETDEEAAWLDEAVEALDHGVSFPELKEKACAKFGRPLPPAIVDGLRKLWAERNGGEGAV